MPFVAAMKMDGVYLLDREMDADHNRCVITLVGEREAIQEAAIRGVGKAAELIDLNHHQGRIRGWGRRMWCRLSRLMA
jgi:glutamate formiminotransferase